MCIRDRNVALPQLSADLKMNAAELSWVNMSFLLASAAFCICLLYTSDAADDLLCVDLGGRRIIKKKNIESASHPPIRSDNITTQYT